MPAVLVEKASKSKEWEELVVAHFFKQAEAVAKNAQPLLMPLYQKTMRFWNQSGQNKFPLPSVIIQFKVKKTRYTVRVVIDVKVVSDLWAWLDQGTPDIIQPRKSPPIRERRELRTTPDQLDVRPFGGFTGRTFVIHAGRKRRGIPARHWTRTIARLYRQASEVKPDAFNNLMVVKVLVNGALYNA